MNKPKIKEISKTLFEVNGYSVKIQIRRGRRLLLCSCKNHTKFCQENPFCFHKQLVLEYINLKPFKLELEKLIKDYTKYKDCKLVPSVDLFLDELKRLEKL